MNLTGQFHSHITVLCESKDIPKLKSLCGKLYCKVTVIDLKRDNRIQQDIMLTHYFHTEHGSYRTVEEIRSRLEDVCNILKNNNFNPVRTKLEHESLPTNAPSPETYREIHFKCVMNEKDRDNIIRQMSVFDNNIVPSSNPFEKLEDGKIVQFFNKRYYDGTVEGVDNQSELIVAHLNKLCDVKEVKRESIVFDTNIKHDKWWA